VPLKIFAVEKLKLMKKLTMLRVGKHTINYYNKQLFNSVFFWGNPSTQKISRENSLPIIWLMY